MNRYFPVKSYNLTSALGEKDFYGVRRSDNGEWYLWPGWCIFNFDKFTTKPNFEPIYTKKSFLDTGGSNYPRYYYKYNSQNIPFPLVKTWRYKKTEGLNRQCDILHSDCSSFIKCEAAKSRFLIPWLPLKFNIGSSLVHAICLQNQSFFSSPVSSLNALISSSTLSASFLTESHVFSVSYQRALSSSEVLPCCSTHV